MESKMENLQTQSRKYKIVLIGDPYLDMGYLLRELNIMFPRSYKDTIGCDLGVLKIRSNISEIKFTLWDISIDKRFQYLLSGFCKGASGVIFYFDLEYEYFFNKILNLIAKIYSSKRKIPILLLGHNFDGVNKSLLKKLDYLITKLENVRYVEITSMKNLMNAFKTMGSLKLNNEPIENFEIILENQGPLKNMDKILRHKRFEYLKKKEQFNRFKELLKNLGYIINEKNEVEIITSRGIFIINIMKDHIHFEPISCEDCKFHCKNKDSKVYNSLCIVSRTQGWSNLDLANRDLGILSKIVAISDDRLPRHVLNQINRRCPKNTLPDHPQPQPHSEWTLSQLDMKPNASEARALLRNCKVQFERGGLPFSVYNALKDKYEEIINENNN
ncbi:MAG: hypothetical protein GF329_05885 [Candidatus Lokiarchaeota archaeon]|nr:hypothetical protein [Candidatus Lokiarchaeota archaeon]